MMDAKRRERKAMREPEWAAFGWHVHNEPVDDEPECVLQMALAARFVPGVDPCWHCGLNNSQQQFHNRQSISVSGSAQFSEEQRRRAR